MAKRHSTPTKDSMIPFSNRTMYASVSHLIERVTTVLAYATHHLNIANPYSGGDC